MIITILGQFGLSEKEIRVYLALLSLGPAPVRKVALEAGVNRGTTYDILKSLIKLGLASFYHKEKHQYFVAEDPEKLKDALAKKEKELQKTKEKISQIIPELKSIYQKAGQKPVARFYEGFRGIKFILQDLLTTTEKSQVKEYQVYSSANIKEYLYRDFPSFTKERVRRKIKVKVIALGQGKEEKNIELAERKWLSKKETSPTYIIIYNNKLAFISLDAENVPLGVIIEDAPLTQTQKMIFDFIWARL